MTDTATHPDDHAISRRAVLGGGLGVLATFVLHPNRAGAAPGRATSASGATSAAALGAAATGGTVSGWVRVNADNTVTIAFGGAEMGQGIMTGLAQGVAEELMVDWSQVRTEAAPPAQSYVTGGSFGVRRNLGAMRLAGAQALDVLRQAAAAKWKVDPASLTVKRGVFTNPATGAKLKFSQVAAAASALAPAASPR
ncbi:MAG: molybdopterin cofactor-binding domain-containing protein [Acidimicrobiales bacterium]